MKDNNHSVIFGIIVFFFIFFSQNFISAQDSTGCKNILVIEKLERKDWMPSPVLKTFKDGSRVIIRYNNNKHVKGKIKAVYDSSLNIDGTIIYIKNINRIRSFRGSETIAAGMSLLALCINIRMYADNNYFSDYDEGGNDMNGNALFGIDIFSSLFAFVGGVEAAVGLVVAASAKNYHLDENIYKVYVMPKAEFDKRQSALSPPYQRLPKNKTKNPK